MVGDQLGRWRRRLSPTLLTAVIAVVCLGWFLLRLPGPLGPNWLPWALELAACLITWWACWRTSHRLDLRPRIRVYWRRLSLVPPLLFAAVVANMWTALTGPDAPTLEAGPWTVLFALAAQGAGVWAFFRLPVNAAQRIRWPAFLLDTASIGVGVALVAWYTTVHPWGAWSVGVAGPWWLLSLFGVGVIGTLACARMLTADTGTDVRSVRLIGLAGLVAAANGPLLAVLADRPHLNGSHLVVPAVCLLVTRAASTRRTDPPVQERAIRFPTDAFPFAAVAVTSALLLIVVATGGEDALVVAIGAVGITALVTARQMVAYFDNTRLVKRLDASLDELRASEDRLLWQANHDALTGLSNRSLFHEKVRAALESADAPARVAVVMVDLDDFKTINDRLGHPVGDALLRVVSGRLRGCVRPGDVVGRLGGDEFALLLPGLDEGEAGAIVERLVRGLSLPFSAAGHELLISASVGLADGRPNTDADTLLRNADLAMYTAKERGKNDWARYDAAMGDRVVEHARIAAEIRQALERQEFTLNYQPLVALPEAEMVAVETLVRWRHPTRGMVPPDQFIPVAERTGLIVPLGRWIRRAACAQAAAWRRLSPAAPLRVWVNVSARELREPTFVDDVAAALRDAGLEPALLTVEVTETAVFDGGPAITALNDLRALGVQIALDDFGTGHSSLGLLRTCPVDVIKLDRSFVEGVTGASEQAAIATFMIQIANGLGLGTVAEGVETAEQAARLAELGYPLAQGYHFARPAPPEQITEALLTRGAAPAGSRELRAS